MTFEERLDRARTLLSQTRLPRLRGEPLEHRLFWRLGVRVRPPHFGFDWRGQVTPVAMSTWFLLVTDALRGVPLAAALAVWLLVSAILIAVFARDYAREAERLGLPSWEELDRVEVPILPRRSILGL